MLSNYNQLKALVEALPDGAQKDQIGKVLSKVKKDLSGTDFKLQRTLKDKAIMVNLLNASIEDLQKHQQTIEEAHERLSQRKQEIEVKNLQLNYQKQLLENKSLQLKRNLQELERSYIELEQFSYIASHDLKSPLRTIANFAQLLQKRYLGQLDEQADEFINFIISGTNNMNNVISDLLEYSRVGVKGKDFVETDLNKVLDLVQFNLGEAIREEGATIIAPTLPTLTVNKQGMVQLLQNLLGNAIKFRKKEEPLVIKIEWEKEGDLYLFRVSDNGVGMDEEFQEKAFKPFQRLNNRDRPGTGMGLAICKKVVALHRGTIQFSSTVGKGTTFSFTIGSPVCSEKTIEAPSDEVFQADTA